MNRPLPFFIALLCLAAVLPLSGQQHRARWNYEDYFSKNYFSRNDECNDAAGELVFYMRLAGIKPLRDITLQKNESLVRLNYTPKFTHPLFIQVQKTEDNILLTWQKGKAIKGYVVHKTLEAYTSSGGFVDITEEYYYGNEWEKGIADSGSRQLSFDTWQQIQDILTDINFEHYQHQGHMGYMTPFILEYAHDNTKISHYTEWPDKKKEDRLAKLLLSLVDTNYIDMKIRSAMDAGTVAPVYPGGEDSCMAFIERSIHYPTLALLDWAEYRCRVELVVEKDGSIGLTRDDSWPKSDYGFADELIRVVKSMPKWQPATQNGVPVRCYTRVNYHFVLPEDIRPKYGNPILETDRDIKSWETIEGYYHQVMCNPFNVEATLWLGKSYYREYLLENQPLEEPEEMDLLPYENEQEETRDLTAVVIHPGDSALKYFYKVLEISENEKIVTNVYMPILQLEQQLHRPHNPLAELPYDTVPGVHLPYSYFINWPKGRYLDASYDYYGEAFYSFLDVDSYSKCLTAMQEPVFYNKILHDGDTLYRFSFFPSFHPPVVFAIQKKQETVTLYWKILHTKFDRKSWQVISHSIKKGHRKMTAAQYEKFLQYWETVQFDKLPRRAYVFMTDGAEWVIEQKTPHDFKAHSTNVAGKNITQLYSYLAKLSGQQLKYMEEYAHF